MRLTRARGLAAALLLCAAAGGPAQAEGVRVTYMANAGFLLEGGGRTVLIDGAFGAGVPGYPALSKETLRDLVMPEGPLRGIDLILATHAHPDHLGPMVIAEHLRTNLQARVLTTPQGADLIRSRLAPDAAGRRRVFGVLPPKGEVYRRKISGVPLTLVNLPHAGERVPPVENLGLLVDLGGMRILHVGDTEATREDLQPLHLGAMRVDLALLPFWLLTDPEAAVRVREEIRPHAVVAIHVPNRGAPPAYFGDEGGQAGLLRRLREAFPGAWVPLEPGDVRDYTPTDPAAGTEPLPAAGTDPTGTARDAPPPGR